MYFGYYEHNLDDKGRLMIPSKLREGLVAGSTLYVLKGFEGCLSVYNEVAFNKLTSRLENLPYENKDNRKYIRGVLGSVVQLNVDKLGRIQIPTSALSRYSIDREVVVIGVGDHFEIWDLKAYQEFEEQNNQEFEDVADKLVTKNG